MSLKIALGKWSSPFKNGQPIHERVSKESCSLPMKCASENNDKGLMHKFSEKLEAVLSSFPLESNDKNDAFYSKKLPMDKLKKSLNGGCKSHESFNGFQHENVQPLMTLPKQNSMDRMELTLKLSNHSKLYDSDDSVASSKVTLRSSSQESLSSCSTVSSECIPDDSEKMCKEFMKSFTTKLFNNSLEISYDEKAKFGVFARNEGGRRWFARYINSQRVRCKKVNESTFYSLVQYFSIMLFECSESDDFSPAKSLMNMAFTFYNEDDRGNKEFLFNYLKTQPIWHSLRYWNAAFFEAVQSERENKPMIKSQEIGLCTPEDIKDDESFQENITFGQLGTFTFNMHAFGLSEKFCFEFLRKQSTIANLSQEQESILNENIHQIFANDP